MTKEAQQMKKSEEWPGKGARPVLRVRRARSGELRGAGRRSDAAPCLKTKAQGLAGELRASVRRGKIRRPDALHGAPRSPSSMTASPIRCKPESDLFSLLF